MSGALPGRLVALEGVDGCGKTTQAARLAGALDALLTHEPGATPLGAAIRRLLLHGDAGAGAADTAGDASGAISGASAAPVPRAEALLMAADRAQHVTAVVRPALRAGRWVVTDRFSGSTLAYQGYGRGLPLDGLRAVVDWAADDVTPDLSVLIDVSPATARSRLAPVAPDRLEQLDEAFFARVRDGYLALAHGDPMRWVVLDGDVAPDTVADAVLDAVGMRLGLPSSRSSGARSGAVGEGT
ncbi:MAG: dTMP kinase [Acidimicrobiales bacterium]